MFYFKITILLFIIMGTMNRSKVSDAPNYGFVCQFTPVIVLAS